MKFAKMASKYFHWAEIIEKHHERKLDAPSGTAMYTAEAFKEEVQAAFPNNEIVMNPLSLSVSCHIGPGALAIACSKKIEYCNK